MGKTITKIEIAIKILDPYGYYKLYYSDGSQDDFDVRSKEPMVIAGKVQKLLPAIDQGQLSEYLKKAFDAISAEGEAPPQRIIAKPDGTIERN